MSLIDSHRCTYLGLLRPVLWRCASVLMLCCTLTMLATFVPSRSVCAEEVPELEALQLAALEAAETLDTIQTEVAELNSQYTQTQTRVHDLEFDIAAQRKRASAAIRSNYKLQQAQPSLLDLLLSAEDFNAFISTFHYLESMSRANTQQIDRLLALDHDLTKTLEELERSQTLLAQREHEAEAALQQTQDALAAARERARENAERARRAYEAEQTRRAAEAAAAQDAVSAQNQQDDTQESSDQPPAQDAAESAPADNTTSPHNDPDDDFSVSEPEPAQTESPVNAPADSSEYIWVLASEYGEGDGLMYSATATGDRVTPTSMGIAMRYMPLGTTVELSYNGRVCRAVVNDRGPYIAGREIDLQPAVKHALGFSGLGRVGYRVIG